MATHVKHSPNKKHADHMAVSRIADKHERDSHDGMHHANSTGEMGTVKSVAGGKVIVGPEEAGGCQGDAGIGGADTE